MTVTIKYKARMSWKDEGRVHEDILCNILHEIDTDTMKTIDIRWAVFPQEPEE